MAGLEALQAEIATTKTIVWERVADGTLSLGPSGFPFFASDTGGYRHSPPNRETWLRWVEQTALSMADAVIAAASWNF